MEGEAPEEDYFAKLELVKDIRQKTIAAEKLKLNMKELADELQNEEKSMKDYQTEIELLLQEKMAHVEELRLIHTDINTMENLTKQAKSARQKVMDEMRNVHEDFLTVKKEIDVLRSVVGAAPLEDPENITNILSKEKETTVPEHRPLTSQEAPEVPSLQLSMPMDGKLALAKPTIRQQQPAPMKSCQSCHQLIHRNAPICPLCKAKSRSRNPKKARRKHED